MRFEERQIGTRRRVSSPRGSLHIIDSAGQDPPIVAMHGFPDDSRIYDRLLPYLATCRTIAFDWLGFGRSDRRQGKSFEPIDRQRELLAVLDQLEIEQALLVGHDASGPEAVDFAISHPKRVVGVVLLNTYYGRDDTLHFPEMIALMADPGYKELVDAIVGDESQRLWLLAYTARRFGGETGDPDSVETISVLPQFFGAVDNPIALDEIRSWTGDLPRALQAQDNAIATGKLRALPVPVSVMFGADDPYLNPDLARHLAELFTDSTLNLVDGASHWPQWDQPELLADLIRTARSR